MDDSLGDGSLVPESVAPPSRGGRLRVLVVALAVLGVVGAVAAFSGGRAEAPRSAVDSGAALEAALAAGQPAYVLIHSLT